MLCFIVVFILFPIDCYCRERFLNKERVPITGAGYTHDTNICTIYNDNLLTLWTTLSRYVYAGNQSIPDEMTLHNIALIVKAYLDHHYEREVPTKCSNQKEPVGPVKEIKHKQNSKENDVKFIIAEVKKNVTLIDDIDPVAKIAGIILKRVKNSENGAYLCTKTNEDNVLTNINMAYQTFLEDAKCSRTIDDETLDRSNQHYNYRNIIMNISNAYAQYNNNRKHDNKQENVIIQSLPKYWDSELKDFIKSELLSKINFERESGKDKVRSLKVRNINSVENTKNLKHYSDKVKRNKIRNHLKTQNKRNCQKKAVDKFFSALESIIKTSNIVCKSVEKLRPNHKNHANSGKDKHQSKSYLDDNYLDAFMYEITRLINTRQLNNFNADTIRAMLRIINDETYKNISSLDTFNNMKTKDERKQTAQLVKDMNRLFKKRHNFDEVSQIKLINWLSLWLDLDKYGIPTNMNKNGKHVSDQMTENETDLLQTKRGTDPKANINKDKILAKKHKNIVIPKDNQNINVKVKPDSEKTYKNTKIGEFITAERDLEYIFNYSYNFFKDIFNTAADTDAYITDITDKKEFVELTYVVSHPKVIVFQPQLMVKHRIPYENYVKNMDSIFKNTTSIKNRKQLVKVIKGLSNGENIVLYQSFNIRKPVEVHDDKDYNQNKDFETVAPENTLAFDKKVFIMTDLNNGNASTENVLTVDIAISNMSKIELLNKENNVFNYEQYFESKSYEINNESDFPNKNHSRVDNYVNTHYKTPTVINGKILWTNYPIYRPKYAINHVSRKKNVTIYD